MELGIGERIKPADPKEWGWQTESKQMGNCSCSQCGIWDRSKGWGFLWRGKLWTEVPAVPSVELGTEPADLNKWSCRPTPRATTAVLGGTVCLLKLSCPGLEREWDQEVDVETVELRTERKLTHSPQKWQETQRTQSVLGYKCLGFSLSYHPARWQKHEKFHYLKTKNSPQQKTPLTMLKY